MTGNRRERAIRCRKGLVVALLAAAVALPMAGIPRAPEARAAPARTEYNVILVFLDALRADHVGAYGYGRDTTPSLDRLAREGIVFENHFTTYTVTIGSFMSMITGIHPDSHGVRYVAKDVLPAKIKTLAEVLDANGYFTAWYGPDGDPHLAPEVGFGRGFKTFEIFPENLQAGKSLLDAFLEKNKDRKFFLNFHTYNMHAPYFPAKKYKEKFHSGPSRNDVFEDFQSLDKATVEVIRNALGTKETTFTRIQGALGQKNTVRRIMGDDMLAEIAAKGLLDPEYPTSKTNLYNYLKEKGRGYKFSDLLDIEYKKGLNCDNGQMADYLRMLLDARILEFDTEIIGPLLQRLKELGLYDKTIIIVASDHGDEFCDHGVIGHGATAYDGEIHVPLIVRFPWVKGGKRIPDLTLTIDLMPTLLDALGIDAPALVQGKSLMPAIDDPGRDPVREAVMARYPPAGLLTFRDKKWKFVVDRQGNRQLFHLPSDPAEKNNVLDENLWLAKNLERTLREWSKSLPSYGIEQGWAPFIDESTQEKIRRTGYW